MAVSVEKFRECNPHIAIKDNNGNGLVDEGDAGVNKLTGQKSTDAEIYEGAARAEKGLKAYDAALKNPTALVGGIAVDVIFAPLLTLTSIGYGLAGREGTFGARFANTWTYFPRTFSGF